MKQYNYEYLCRVYLSWSYTFILFSWYLHNQSFSHMWWGTKTTQRLIEIHIGKRIVGQAWFRQQLDISEDVVFTQMQQCGILYEKRESPPTSEISCWVKLVLNELYTCKRRCQIFSWPKKVEFIPKNLCHWIFILLVKVNSILSIYICMNYYFKFKSHFKRLVFLTSLLATLVDIVHLYETDEARMGRPYIKNFSLSLITSSWWVQVHW